MARRILLTSVALLALFSAGAVAQAGGVRVGIGIGVPAYHSYGYYHPYVYPYAPYYVAPYPPVVAYRVYTPPPVYYAAPAYPAPVYPAPVYQTPVYQAPIVATVAVQPALQPVPSAAAPRSFYAPAAPSADTPPPDPTPY
ncbi:MAG: hypothetical protein K8T25_15520 [Planctomycetia bacterium]|nr:hypothetical protein [Planctomycetia bacterium]